MIMFRGNYFVTFEKMGKTYAWGPNKVGNVKIWHTIKKA